MKLTPWFPGSVKPEMNDLRAAAQQALDWLYENDILHPTKVSEDLRAALNQEEEASAWLAERKEYWRKEKEKMKETNDLRAALAQQDERDGSLLDATQESLREHMAEIHRLRAAPPQRKPLTEKEIYHATGHCGVNEHTAIKITRAVERAHGIGGQP